jgi:hypothetical protein
MTKHRLDPIASMIWYQAVEIGLDLVSPTSVELFLEGDRVKPDADGIKRPRKWRNFSQGIRTPKDIPGKLNVYDIADRQAPGTALWFRSPMWKALKGKLANKYEVEAALAESEAIAAIIFEYEVLEFDDEYRQELGLDDSDPPPTYRRFRPDNINRCIDLDGVDLLEAVILLLEFGSASGSLEITRQALELYKASSPKIAKIPEITAFLPEIFEAIEFKYTPDVNAQYDEFLPPWHVRLPDLYEKIVDIEAMREEALRPYESD